MTPSDIREWVHGLTMARSYQRSIFSNVSQIFGAAIADERIAKNPCQSRTVRKPVADPRQIVPWSAEWVGRMMSALPERYAILALLAAGTGLRQGEVFGLSPADIDTARGTIVVRRQVKLTPTNEPYFALPKGRKIRTVPMPCAVARALADHTAQFPARTVALPWDGPAGAPVSVGLLLTTRERKPVNRHYFNARIWKPALVASDIPVIRDNGCHALRHYYASVLLDGGESIKTVSERLGHADPGFTLRTYTHLLPDTESRTRAIVDAALGALPKVRTARAATPSHSRSTGPTRPRREPGYFGPQP